MVVPAEVSKKRSNFRIRQFKEKCQFNIAANLMFNTMIIIFQYTFTCAYCQNSVHRQTDRQTHTHTRENYCNPRCACVPRVNNEKTTYHGIICKRQEKLGSEVKVITTVQCSIYSQPNNTLRVGALHLQLSLVLLSGGYCKLICNPAQA